MSGVFRGLAAGGTYLSTLLFTFWIVAALLQLAGASESIALIVAGASAVFAAQLASRMVRRTVVAPGLVRSVALGALLTGAVGFALGFFGPLLFAPKSNQGPLLGLLITGPLGVLSGAIGGAAYWIWQRPRTTDGFPT